MEAGVPSIELDEFKDTITFFMKLGNHDYTMHQAGIFNDESVLIQEMMKTIDFENIDLGAKSIKLSMNPSEQISIIFQRILLDRAFKESPLFQRLIRRKIHVLNRLLTSIASKSPETEKRLRTIAVYPFLYLFGLDNPLIATLINGARINQAMVKTSKITQTKKLKLKNSDEYIESERLFDQYYLNPKFT